MYIEFFRQHSEIVAAGMSNKETEDHLGHDTTLPEFHWTICFTPGTLVIRSSHISVLSDNITALTVRQNYMYAHKVMAKLA